MVTGKVVVPGPTLAAVFGGRVGAIADRVGHRTLVVVGCTSAGLCPTWLLLSVEEDSSYVTTVLPAHLMLGVGVACSFATFASIGMRQVPPTRFATASATLRTGSSIGFAAGVAIAVAVFSASIADGPAVAYDRAWLFMALTFFAGAVFSAVACPSRAALDPAAPVAG